MPRTVTQLTLSPADGIHKNIVLVHLVLVVLELPLQTLQLLVRELPRGFGLAVEKPSEKQSHQSQK